MRYIRFSVISAWCFLFVACTASHEFVLDYPRAGSLAMQKSLRVAWVGMDPNAGVNQVFMTYSMGKFSTKDLQVIKKSLRDTFAKINTGHATNAAVNLHLYIHRYMLVYSNDIGSGSGMAIAEWCLESEGKVLDKGSVYSINNGKSAAASLSGDKYKVNRVLARHITEAALSKVVPDYKPLPVPGAYTDAQKAVQALPKRVGGSVTTEGFSVGFGTATRYEEHIVFTPFDWEKHLQEFYSSRGK